MDFVCFVLFLRIGRKIEGRGHGRRRGRKREWGITREWGVKKGVGRSEEREWGEDRKKWEGEGVEKA